VTDADARLHAEIAQWDPRRTPPEAVTLLALHEQRAFRLLAHNRRLRERTLPSLRGSLRSRARDASLALRDLFLLSPPTNRKRFKTKAPDRASSLRRFYREGQRRFHVRWQVLAAVNMVETGFGRLRNESTAGAQGPMQFIPSTWRVYGMGGDIHDPHDAILGAANYLHASGAPGSYRHALYAYNNSRLYVNAVLRLSRVMRRSDADFLGLYAWQVFVRTPSGDRRLTGPGRR
jgi:membrane-bound lytic murein transglycosylase B